jgi:hypothetical protein
MNLRGPPWLEQRALVCLILHRDAQRNGLHALEARRRLKVRALLTAVQLNAALRAGAGEKHIRRERRGTVVTTRSRHRLHKPGKTRARNINRGARSGRLRARRAVTSVSVLGRTAIVLVPVLTVLTIGVHAVLKTPAFVMFGPVLTDGESLAVIYWLEIGKRRAPLEAIRWFEASAYTTTHSYHGMFSLYSPLL